MASASRGIHLDSVHSYSLPPYDSEYKIYLFLSVTQAEEIEEEERATQFSFPSKERTLVQLKP